MTNARAKIGLVGARGHVGRELVALVAKHPRLSLSFVASSTRAGEKVSAHVEGAPSELVFEAAHPEAVADHDADVFLLALPNGLAESMVSAIERARPNAIVVDVSADYRFDDAWVWGLPELRRARLAGAKRIANPGCYATAMALAIAPVAHLLAGPAHAFGVSGYSGAGTAPSPRNDVDALRDNLMPYSLVKHVHEREVSKHVAPVFFVPHVAPFFRGIAMTVSLSFASPVSTEELRARYEAAYGHEPLIKLQVEPPFVRDIANRPEAVLGGFTTDPERRHGVVVATIDNLLKGAASQALQNINLALGFPELTGIEPWQS